jgi:hypothetical protein
MSLAGSVFAQETLCLNLSETDCELYTGLMESAKFPLSTAFELNIDGAMVVGDIPQPVEFNVLATGAYVFDSVEAEAAIAKFADLSVLDVSLGSILDVTDGVFSAFDAELNVQMTLPPDMGGSAFGPFDFWLVDGAGYMDMTPVGVLSGDPNMAGVMGVDVFDFIEVPLGELKLGDIFERLNSMGDDFEPGDFNMMNDENPFQNVFAQFANQMTEEDLASFISMERLPDETVNGTNVVVFQTTIDFAAIFEVEAIRNQIAAQMEMQGTEMPEGMDIDTIMSALAKSLAGSTMTVVEKIDPQTAYGIATSITIDLTIDPAPFNAIEDTGMTEPIEFDLTMEMTWTDINSVQSIELPEDAQLIPVETLLGGF